MDLSNYTYLLEFKKITSLEFTKLHHHVVDIPILLPYSRAGYYLIKIRDKITKVGIYGLGAETNLKSRFKGYRKHGIDFTKAKKTDGSYNTVKYLVDNLNLGEHATVEVYEAPEKYFYRNEQKAPINLNMLQVEADVKECVSHDLKLK